MEKTCGKHPCAIDGLTLHYYTIPNEWAHKGSATEFTEAEWLVTMQKAYFMDELVHKHGAIMDEYDPANQRFGHKVSLIVDEWGTWLDPEPGTNPSFLYQQNTLRDALVAGIHFNIFNNYCERVGMANIAQTINVLQSVILTEGANMIVTPTYHVFDMYKVHHDAIKLPLHVESETVSLGYSGSIPAVSASASEDDKGRIHVSIVNIDPKNEQAVSLDLRGISPLFAGGQIITSENMQDHNTFDHGDKVGIKDFHEVKSEGIGGRMTVNLPPKSVVTLELG
jgi:alpha-N-arabinofuranosidase